MIEIKKPTKDEIEMLSMQPTWGCEVSKFDWSYSEKETALILEGEVTVSYNGKDYSIKAGDLVVFGKGVSCIWDVKKPIRKHYLFSS